VLNIATGRQYSLLELVDSINRALGTNVEPAFAPARAGDVRESVADISAARDALGYRPQVDFDEGLRRSVDYYRSIS
jgi:UDP-glucose 4-epimerase